jgi:acyl-lipid omega-6 desaturase (Delta-12 desaturase)
MRLLIEHGSNISLSEERTWTQILRSYHQPSTARSLFELTITALPLAALWGAAWLVFSLGYWWATILIAFPAAGFLVRLFMIQHDCGHGSFCPKRWTNDWLGRAIGVITLTPYDFWRRTHAIHHATSGNLDRRGIGDVDTLTVREYLESSHWGRWKYRLYRNPLILFVLGPVYVFLLRYRLPFGLMRAGLRPWISTQATNVAIASVAAVLIWLIGINAFLLVHLPIMLLAAMFGVWLFYVQHQFENTFWDEHQRWDLHDAALNGSSYYDLPQPLRWFTANIGIHHVHHLCSRIPFYRLPCVVRDHPEFSNIGRITVMQSFRCVRFVLWDENQRRLISFRELGRLSRD